MVLCDNTEWIVALVPAPDDLNLPWADSADANYCPDHISPQRLTKIYMIKLKLWKVRKT